MPDASNDSVDAAEPSTPREPPKRSSGGKAKQYACYKCAYVATSKEDSWRHSRSHIPADKQLSCKHCEFVTEYKHHLEWHIRNHFQSKPFRCPYDACSFANKSMLSSHMKSHLTEYPFSCIDCSYQSRYCHSFKIHLRKYNHRRKPGIDVDDAAEALANDPSLDEEPEESNVRKVKATTNDKEKDETNQLISLAQPTSAAVTASDQDELASLRSEEKILHEKLTQHVEPQMTEKKTESIQSIVNSVSNAQFDVDQLTPPNTAEFQATMASLMEAAKTTAAEFQTTMATLMEAAKTAVNNAAAVAAANANNSNAKSGNNSPISTIPSAIDSLRSLSQGEQTTNLAHLLHMPDASNDFVDSAELSTPREPPSSYGKAKQYPCRQCAYVAISKGDSWRHSRSHIPADKQLSCKQCEFVTEYKHHLEYHIRNHQYRPFQCPYDGYSCVNQSMLNSHMKCEHPTKFHFSCFDCSFQSKYCHYLKVHLRTYNHRRKPGFDVDDAKEALANDPSLDEEGCSAQSGFNDSMHHENNGDSQHLPPLVSSAPAATADSLNNIGNALHQPIATTSSLPYQEQPNAMAARQQQQQQQAQQNVPCNKILK
uniref:C2H2-type domain-containing protein n=1 Tax=Panagrolaimus davidi TaxID=227884 RepID=A0A914PI54_9BILA